MGNSSSVNPLEHSKQNGSTSFKMGKSSLNPLECSKQNGSTSCKKEIKRREIESIKKPRRIVTSESEFELSEPESFHKKKSKRIKQKDHQLLKKYNISKYIKIILDDCTKLKSFCSSVTN